MNGLYEHQFSKEKKFSFSPQNCRSSIARQIERIMVLTLPTDNNSLKFNMI